MSKQRNEKKEHIMQEQLEKLEQRCKIHKQRYNFICQNQQCRSSYLHCSYCKKSNPECEKQDNPIYDTVEKIIDFSDEIYNQATIMKNKCPQFQQYFGQFEQFLKNYLKKDRYQNVDFLLESFIQNNFKEENDLILKFKQCQDLFQQLIEIFIKINENEEKNRQINESVDKNSQKKTIFDVKQYKPINLKKVHIENNDQIAKKESMDRKQAKDSLVEKAIINQPKLSENQYRLKEMNFDTIPSQSIDYQNLKCDQSQMEILCMIDFLFDNNHYLALAISNQIIIYQFQVGKDIWLAQRSLIAHEGQINDLIYISSQNLLCSAGQDNKCIVWITQQEFKFKKLAQGPKEGIKPCTALAVCNFKEDANIQLLVLVFEGCVKILKILLQNNENIAVTTIRNFAIENTVITKILFFHSIINKDNFYNILFGTAGGEVILYRNYLKILIQKNVNDNSEYEINQKYEQQRKIFLAKQKICKIIYIEMSDLIAILIKDYNQIYIAESTDLEKGLFISLLPTIIIKDICLIDSQIYSIAQNGKVLALYKSLNKSDSLYREFEEISIKDAESQVFIEETETQLKTQFSILLHQIKTATKNELIATKHMQMFYITKN